MYAGQLAVDEGLAGGSLLAGADAAVLTQSQDRV